MEGYDKHVGIIMVGVSDMHILKALRDSRIDMVIPYHASGINRIVKIARSIDAYTDYTKMQNTRHRATGKAISKRKEFDFYLALHANEQLKVSEVDSKFVLTDADGNQYVDVPRKTAQDYLDWCKKNDYIPKFDKFSGEENYYKLLADFRMYDANGMYAPQTDVTMNYPENFFDLMTKGLRDAQDTTDRFEKEQTHLINEIAKALPKKAINQEALERMTEDEPKGFEEATAEDSVATSSVSKGVAKAMADQFAGQAQNARRMRILVACEESQAIATRLRLNGHEAYSCDIKECSGGHPEYHIQGDVLSLLNGNVKFRTQSGLKGKVDGKWDMIIAHPPCTYLTSTGNRWFNEERYGESARQRKADRLAAADFFMAVANADCDKIAIENPVGYMNTAFRKPDQIIQPYQFGDPFEKKTCLWLKGLAPLKSTKVVEPEPRVVYKSGKTMAAWYANASGDRSEVRSKTFPGIADAVAEQFAGQADVQNARREKLPDLSGKSAYEISNMLQLEYGIPREVSNGQANVLHGIIKKTTIRYARNGGVPYGTVGATITGDFIRKGYVDLRGIKLSKNRNIAREEIASIAQIFRDPHFETFRIVYVKNGEIVGTEATTSYINGASAWGKSRDEYENLTNVKIRKFKLGADGFYLIHNHPSGDPTASNADYEVSKMLKKISGYLGHVVVDHNRYSFIDDNLNGWDGKSATVPNVTYGISNDDLHSRVVDHPLLLKEISAHMMQHYLQFILYTTKITRPSFIAIVICASRASKKYITVL